MTPPQSLSAIIVTLAVSPCATAYEASTDGNSKDIVLTFPIWVSDGAKRRSLQTHAATICNDYELSNEKSLPYNYANLGVGKYGAYNRIEATVACDVEHADKPKHDKPSLEAKSTEVVGRRPAVGAR